jgi:hypothetical protein
MASAKLTEGARRYQAEVAARDPDKLARALRITHAALRLGLVTEDELLVDEQEDRRAS